MINEKTNLPEFPSKYRKSFDKKLQEIVNKYLKKYKTEKSESIPNPQSPIPIV